MKLGDATAAQFAGTRAGVQLALDYCESGGGGTVLVDAGAGILITDTSIKIPNRVRLVGTGAFQSTPTFTAGATTSVTAMIENKTQDGTQQYAYIEHIQVYGNKSTGAIVTAGVYFKKVYVGSSVKDCLIWSCSGNGLKMDGSTSGGLGEVYLENLFVNNCDDDNILITGQTDSIYGLQITSESVAAGKAQIRIDRAGAATAPKGHLLMGVQFEGTAAYDGLVLNECNSVTVMNISDDGSGAANSLIKITGSVSGSDGSFAAGGHTVINARANLTTIIDDQTAGVTVGNAQGRFVRWYTSPVNSATLDNSQIVGIQMQRQATVTAAATLTLGNGNSFLVAGNTGITSINTAARDKGRIVTLIFSGTPTVTDGSNLNLNGSFSAAADDTLTLVSDGTDWYEVGRSGSTTDVSVGGILYQSGWNAVASATDVTLPSGNLFVVSGSTTINKLLPMPSGKAQVIHLKFTAAITIQSHSVAAGNIFLRGSTNFYAIDQDVLTLGSDGTNWVEISRRTIGHLGTTTITAAATIAIPAYGEVFHVTGATNITNGITVNSADFGRTVVLIFDSTPTVSDTGTSRLNGDLVAVANTTLTIKCDGSNWYEMARSAN